MIYVHRGGGVLRTVFGRVPFREKDYVVIPRGTTHTFELDAGEQTWLCFHTPGEIETPNRYRNRYGLLLEHAPYSQRDFHGPAELETYDESGEYPVTVRVRGGHQDYVLDRHPFDVVGWDGYVWPYTFNADDFEPRAGRFHLPPPAHQTFQGPNFVICTFAPRMLDWDPEAVPLPYHHSNIQSEEVMFYAEGDYAARKGVEVGSITLHPSGLPHGPQPGAVEKALGSKSTDELAIMWDTFRPLRLTHALARPRQARVRALLEPGPVVGPVFEEGQLYSPVTQGENGVVVHLGVDHPGANDPEYRARRSEIAAAALAWRPGEPAPAIEYTDREQEVWRIVCRELAVKHERYACRAYREAAAALALPRDAIPGLDEVSARLEPLTGFRYLPAAGLVPLEEFYGALADRVFHSTQYIRHWAAPLYTPEPDLIHEVIGHGNLLASPEFAELNLLAGQAARRCETGDALRFLAHVFWFTIEFGVLHEDGELRAYGAGHPLELRRDRGVPPDGDPARSTTSRWARSTTTSRKYQPVLYSAESMTHLMESLGGFFAGFDDDTPERLSARSADAVR